MKVNITRNTFVGGQFAEAGSAVDVDAKTAAQLVAAGKAAKPNPASPDKNRSVGLETSDAPEVEERDAGGGRKRK